MVTENGKRAVFGVVNPNGKPGDFAAEKRMLFVPS